MTISDLTIVVLYSCPECDLKDVEVTVPARTTEDIIDWMNQTNLLLAKDHGRRSPRCFPRVLKNVKIPMHQSDRVGGASVQ